MYGGLGNGNKYWKREGWYGNGNGDEILIAVEVCIDIVCYDFVLEADKGSAIG